MNDKILVERAVAVPLLERLRRVPPDARLEYEHDPCHHSVFPIGAMCHEAATRIEALEAALRWYADKDNWRTKGHPQIDWNNKPILHDQGHRAKQALESQP